MNRSKTIRAHRPPAHPAHLLNATATIAAAVGVLLLLTLVAVPAASADPGNDNRAPQLEGDAARLTVEGGNKLAFHAWAVGVQVYRWNGASWDFVAPEAVLFATDPAADPDPHSGVIGTHYAGPTWESSSGSTVVAAVNKRSTPADPSAIDWLLLKSTATEGPGIFHRVTFIQRLYTTGGKAPSAAGTVFGEEARIPYTAEYFFYRKAQH